MSLASFLDWLESTGVDTQNVRVAHDTHTGFGLYTSRSLPDIDTLVVAIPERLFIVPVDNDENKTGFEQLIGQLIQQRTHPYVQFLRSIDPVPVWCRFPADDYPSQIESTLNKHREKYSLTRLKFSQYDDELFQWAYYTVNTRCVHLDRHGASTDPDDNLCLIPFFGRIRQRHASTSLCISSV
jgi:hypothetical protein